MSVEIKDSILICDKIGPDTENISQYLRQKGYVVRVICDEQEAISLIPKFSYSLILLGADFSVQGELFFIEFIKKYHPQTLVILLISRQYPFKKTIEASRKGAYDFLDKSLSLNDFLAVVKKV